METYVESFKPHIMDVVFAWANGASFSQICKMTDAFEGKNDFFLCIRLRDFLIQLELSHNRRWRSYAKWSLCALICLCVYQAVLFVVCDAWKNSWDKCVKHPKPLETQSWKTSLQRVIYFVLKINNETNFSFITIVP